MTTNNKRTAIWYEATDGNGGWSYETQAQAQSQIDSMSKGFPENEYMSDDNRAYWRKASTRYYITRVIKSTKRV